MAEAPPSADHPPGLASLCLAATEHAPLPMATLDGTTHIVRYGNPAFCRVMDKSLEQLVGKPLSDLLPQKDTCATLLDRVYRTGKPASHTEKDPSKPHPVFWSYTLWPVLADELHVGIMIQVTETMKVHEATVAMNEALLLGSLRQHELTAAAEKLNAQLQAEITARQQTARELAEKARLLDLSHDAIIVRDLEGRIRYWNHGAEELYGWSSEEVLGKLSETLFQTEYPTPLERITEELHRTGRWTGELVHTKRNGRRITVLARKTLDRDSQGNPAAVLQSITDITERKRAEEALREAGERFRFMAESMPQKIFTAKPDGDVDYYNRQWTEFTGLAFDQIKGRGWKQFIHPDDLEENIFRWNHSIETGEDFELEHRFRRFDGGYRWHISRAYALRDDEGKVTMWIGSNTDIDDMIRAQEELVDAQAQLADRAVQLEARVAERTAELTLAHAELLAESDERKRLEGEVTGAIEGERERLGQELHDGLAQDLTGIALMLHVLEQELKKPAPALAAKAHRLCLMLEEAHDNARDMAKSLYPVELEQHGLLAALKEVASRTRQQFGVSCSVQANARAMARFKGAVAVQLYRIAQEAVHNAAKHAGAKEVLIRLQQRGGNWVLTVKDDGVGLRSDAREAGGMGLQIMQYRARIIKGTLSVSNDDRGGVIVSCTAPVVPAAKAPGKKTK